MSRDAVVSRVAPAARWFRTPLGARLVTALACGFMVIQGARFALAYRERTELTRFEALHMRSEPAAAPTAPMDDLDARLERGAPAGGQPGPVLKDLVRLLRDAEVYEYRYQFLDAAAAAKEDAPEQQARAFERPAIPVASAFDPGAAESAESLPALELPREDPAAPGEWTRWRLALEFTSSYPRLVQFLENLRADGRVWTVPRMVCRREQGMVTTDLVLETFTRPADAPRNAGSTPLTAREPRSVAPHRDPFRDRWVATGAGSPRRALPHLGAVSRGSLEAAWLDGQRIRPGESIGEWTLMAIQDGEVVLRDAEGKDVRLGSGATR